MRVQDVRDYVAWLLKDNPGWGRDQIDEVIRSGQRTDVKLAQPVNVYWVYITAWATPDGIVQFRSDVYQRDGRARAARLSRPGATDGVAAGITRSRPAACLIVAAPTDLGRGRDTQRKQRRGCGL